MFTHKVKFFDVNVGTEENNSSHELNIRTAEYEGESFPCSARINNRTYCLLEPFQLEFINYLKIINVKGNLHFMRTEVAV
jgi:hypothetical protein